MKPFKNFFSWYFKIEFRYGKCSPLIFRGFAFCILVGKKYLWQNITSFLVLDDQINISCWNIWVCFCLSWYLNQAVMPCLSNHGLNHPNLLLCTNRDDLWEIPFSGSLPFVCWSLLISICKRWLFLIFWNFAHWLRAKNPVES